LRAAVAGVKIDFMDRNDQWMVEWYRHVMELAAEPHLMIDFHGAFPPDGLRRTYSNLMTREGVMGKEYLKWSVRTTPAQNATLPFTRMLAGPMDYTPGAFGNSNLKNISGSRRSPTGSPRHQQRRVHHFSARSGLRYHVLRNT